MAKIKVLSEEIASKIAAGEVIQRPESVVKELIENSIDAGAKSIEIEVKEAGKSFIRVTDDGAGMTEEDAVLAFRRHATSKIETYSDLENVVTLGFRGEALYSIAAVSQVELKTKTDGRRCRRLFAYRRRKARGDSRDRRTAQAPPSS